MPDRALARPRLLLLALPLAGGIGLLVYVLVGLSLPLAMAVTGVLGMAALAGMLTRASASDRRALRERLRVGFGAGLLATLAYDLVRFLAVRAFAFTFWPFESFEIFGRLIVGGRLPPPWPLAVGTLYHFFNGIGFAVAFVLLVRRPGLWSGLLWAMCLEGLMVAIYPAWLRIRSLEQFLVVSVLGHAVWGSVLGIVAGRAVGQPRHAEASGR
ncbi:MAG: hypothetical protein QN174_06305 [Armatimonadota bacterium]|nr:hypothetical protein [Armatimonadota bacterium]MDR7422520.1 hypothetical protein [Armatimonadota bacterium]MDR7455370.1 hypothetical protein [Armatimonadota bacterium]MDR7457156.1 hypothetical protein [Armatimonadota bacterium]MDR7496552.1 hypothetical protein [Armatimonadota bacterium]